MRIGLLAPASRRCGGTFQYTYSLLEALLNYSKYKQDLFILTNKEVIVKDLEGCKDLIVLDIKPSNLLLKGLRVLYVNFPFIRNFLDVSGNYKIIKKLPIDLIIIPIISLAPLYSNKPYIITIHDLQHKYYPEFFTVKERLTRNYVYRNAAKNAMFIVCESQFVKSDIIKFLGISSDKIRIIPSVPPSYLVNLEIKVDYLKEIKTKYELPERFLLYPAQFWYHKNHINLLKAISLIIKKYKEDISVIFVGLKKNNFENTMNEMKRLKLENHVKYLGYVPDKDIPYLYKLSIALVMPTLFESVSMPIWEAFYLGCPVVSSEICALPEQISDAGLLFNPYDVKDMAEKIYKIWTDEKLRERFIKKGHERVKGLTIENYTRQWEKVIAEALKQVRKVGRTMQGAYSER